MNQDFCDKDTGFDYIFTRMSAIYGAGFSRHWDGINANHVREEWKRQLGIFLTYRPSMDYAIDCLSADYPPSAIKFRNLCIDGPRIPRDDKQIVYEPKPIDPEIVADAKRKLAEFRKQWTN